MPDLNDEEKSPTQYSPSEKVTKLIGSIWAKWQKVQEQRQAAYRFFNDRTLIDYINDSVDRFNGYIAPRVDPAADWGAKVFNNITRQKTVAIIAQITAERVKAEFFPQDQNDENDMIAAELIKKLEENSYYKNKDDEQQFYSVLEAAMRGTCIGYEGYKVDKRKIKEIIEYNPDSGEIKFKEKEITDWDDVYGETIPLFDFYPGNIWVRSMQKQPFVIWRTVLDEDVFKAEFEKFPNAKFVVAGQSPLGTTTDDRAKQSADTTTDGTTTTFVSDSIRDGQVEVIRYFDKWNDIFHVVANGVLLTPLVSPLPWDHKDYPFWKTMFEPFAEDFFYGKSLPDKLRSNQDVLNDLYRMMLDQSFLSVNPPMMSQGIENIRDERLFPGARIQVDDLSQTKVMEIPGPTPAHFNILQMVENNMKKDSLDDASSGQSGSRTTAFEIGVVKEASQKILSLFLRALEWGVRDKTELRVRNILQFYRMPQVKGILGEEDELEYRKIVLDNTDLPDNTKGRHVIQLMGQGQEMPDAEQITRAELWYMAKGQNIAFSYMSTELLKRLHLLIRIIPNSSIKMSESLRRAMELDYQKNVMTLYPDMVNREESFRSLNQAFDKVHEKMVTPAPQGQMPGQVPGQPGGAQPNAAPASAPSMNTPNSAAQAGVPDATSTSNSIRNIPA